MATPSGPCWSAISLTATSPAGPLLPQGVGDGDRLVWLNGAWVAVPSTAPARTGPDSIYGKSVPSSVMTGLDLIALGIPLDRRIGYFNKATGAVLVFDNVTHEWVVHSAIKGDEFIDLDSGKVYPLRTLEELCATPSADMTGHKDASSVPTNPGASEFVIEVGDGFNRRFVIHHRLGTIHLVVDVEDPITHKYTQPAPKVSWADKNTVIVEFDTPPALNSQRITVRKI